MRIKDDSCGRVAGALTHDDAFIFKRPHRCG
jgi:hypothetical protein